jgi:hypothetical protein
VSVPNSTNHNTAIVQPILAFCRNTYLFTMEANCSTRREDVIIRLTALGHREKWHLAAAGACTREARHSEQGF